MIEGVIDATSGYAGGNVPNPTYEQVSTGTTGHAEVLLVEYDPKKISFEKLLAVYFDSHDPTQINRQGPDVGPQYRSILLYTTNEQKEATEKYIKKLTEAKKYKKPIVTEVVPLEVFYPAEEYHKNYYAKHREGGYSEAVIKPKVEKIKEKYAELLKK